MLILADAGILDQEPGAPADENLDNIYTWLARRYGQPEARAQEADAKLHALLDKLETRTGQ